MFGKKKRKLDRRMRRRIRKTSAVMLLISAITVAAIPVPEAAAAGSTAEPATHGNSITTDKGLASDNGEIPKLTKADKIYCTSDNKYQFAYRNVAGHDNQGILVGYIASSLPNKHLAMPESLEAYVPYTTSEGTNRGQAAANRDGTPLYYKRISQATLTRTGTWNEAEQKYSYGPWGQADYAAPVTETSLNANRFLYQASSEDDGEKSVQTVYYYTFKFFPCTELKSSEWKIDDVNYYLYKIDGTGNQDTENMSSDHWEYCKLPSDQALNNVGITDLRDTAGIADSIMDAGILENHDKTKKGYFFDPASEIEDNAGKALKYFGMNDKRIAAYISGQLEYTDGMPVGTVTDGKYSKLENSSSYEAKNDEISVTLSNDEIIVLDLN